METLERLRALLPGEIGEGIEARRGDIREVRLRAGRPAQLVYGGGDWLSRTVVDAAALNRILAALMDYSLYAREDELRQGFFTLADGCRVGVCGRLVAECGRVMGMSSVGSLCVRISREIRGCAEALLQAITAGGGVRSTLVISPPGMGKTTLLRETARRLSDGGLCVCVADERHELAACNNGVPTLDVGARTDVMDGGLKSVTIPLMLRAAAPEVIVADEIGGPGDAEALAEAARCGVRVIASAHAGSFPGLMRRRALRAVIDTGAFEIGALLYGAPGRVAEIRAFDGEGWHALGAGAVRGCGQHHDGQGADSGRPAAGDAADGADPGP